MSAPKSLLELAKVAARACSEAAEALKIAAQACSRATKAPQTAAPACFIALKIAGPVSLLKVTVRRCWCR